MRTDTQPHRAQTPPFQGDEQRRFLTIFCSKVPDSNSQNQLLSLALHDPELALLEVAMSCRASRRRAKSRSRSPVGSQCSTHGTLGIHQIDQIPKSIRSTPLPYSRSLCLAVRADPGRENDPDHGEEAGRHAQGEHCSRSLCAGATITRSYDPEHGTLMTMHQRSIKSPPSPSDLHLCPTPFPSGPLSSGVAQHPRARMIRCRFADHAGRSPVVGSPRFHAWNRDRAF